MAANDTINIFEELANLSDEIDVNWNQANFGPWLAHYNVLAWPLSVQHDAGAPVYDYYLVQIEGEVSFLDNNTGWQLDSHAIDVLPGGDLSVIELIDTSPSTTAGATSYTTGIVTTVSGSIGFMGDVPTGSVSTSVSLNNSQTRNIDDVVVENVSMRDMNPPINASWRFQVAAGTPTAEDNCPVNVEFLYRTPHGAGLSLGVAVSAYLAGGDPGELLALCGADGNATTESNGDPVQVMPGFEGQADPYYAGKGRFQVYKTLTFAAPPTPKAPAPAA